MTARVPEISAVKHVNIDGVDFAYIEAGRGQPLILVHGSMNDYRGWEVQVLPFAKHFRVVAYSRRYHWPNIAEPADFPYTVQQHAYDLIALTKKLGFKQVALVGHSFGAAIALTAAAQHPEMISKLVLAEPTMLLPNQSHAADIADRDSLETRVRAAFARGDSVRAVAEFVEWTTGQGSWQKTPPQIRLHRLENSTSLRLQVSGPPDPRELSCDDIGKITSPCLLVTGAETKPYFTGSIQDIQVCLPNARLVTIPKAGHGMPFQNPKEFNKAVLEFLRSKKP